MGAACERRPQSQDEGSGCYLCPVGQAAEEHRLKETQAGITMKLKRGTFSLMSFLACLAATELEAVVLQEI
jgi:hypothetical protein